ARGEAEAARGFASDLDHPQRQVGDRDRLDRAATWRPGAGDSPARQGGRAPPGAAQVLNLANQTPPSASNGLMRAFRTAVLLGVFAAFVPAASGGSQRAEYSFRQVASGFDQPVYVVQP